MTTMAQATDDMLLVVIRITVWNQDIYHCISDGGYIGSRRRPALSECFFLVDACFMELTANAYGLDCVLTQAQLINLTQYQNN